MQVITEIKNIVEKVPEGILISPEDTEHEVIGACYMNDQLKRTLQEVGFQGESCCGLYELDEGKA